MNFWKFLLTGKDNASWDVARVLLFCGGMVLLSCTISSVLKSVQFDIEKFGYGLGALPCGGGIGTGARAHAEPGRK